MVIRHSDGEMLEKNEEEEPVNATIKPSHDKNDVDFHSQNTQSERQNESKPTTSDTTALHESESEEDNSCCSGHRRALPQDRTINDLDVREEILSTLLAYLELHPRNWLHMLNPLRTSCSVKCYGGPEQFQLLASKFPPVALAVRELLGGEEKTKLYERRQLDLDYVEVADLMCWDVLTVLRELKALQWNMSFALDAQLNTTGKSGIIVESDHLSFHFTTAQSIGEDEKEEICDFLHSTVTGQEETRIIQLDALYCVLKELSCQRYDQIPAKKRMDAKARQQIGQFFLCKEDQQIEFLKGLISSDLKIDTPARRWNNIAGDVRGLVLSYPDSDFTGRAIARIFQGIESPRFPAIVYGRDRRFWRQYIDVDFNELKRFAVRELARFRC